jgi:hypothetical protein
MQDTSVYLRSEKKNLKVKSKKIGVRKTNKAKTVETVVW